jgi:hypothetical protein
LGKLQRQKCGFFANFGIFLLVLIAAEAMNKKNFYSDEETIKEKTA